MLRPKGDDGMVNGNAIKEHDHYTISISGDGKTMLFTWKQIPGLSAESFADGITDFATQCATHQPSRAVIDARQLDQESQAVNWLRGRTQVDGLDAYDAWWVKSIVPLYHDARIASLTVATGDPEAPGEIPTPPGVNFRMGYFFDVDAASSWPSS
jgi:hypothetical protein